MENASINICENWKYTLIRFGNKTKYQLIGIR